MWNLRAWRGLGGLNGQRAIVAQPANATGHKSRLVVMTTGVAMLVSCQTVQTTQGGTVGVDRKQVMSPLVSREQVDDAARTQYAAVLTESKQKGVLNKNAADTERVRRISQRLIPHTAVFRADAVKWPWEVNVIESPEVNAWCMPSGKIAVYSGLIDKLKITDEELAAVLGHEIAHALREHARERMSRAAPLSFGVQVVGAIYGQGVGELGNLFGQAFFVLPNSRENEQEADRIGVELAARAGFDPRAASSLWQKMAALGSAGTPEFLSTHPSSASRIADVTEYAGRVLPLYEQRKKSN